MNAEILCVGTEILLGDILNTNAQYLAKQLARLGITVHYQTAVGDNPDRIRAALDVAFSRAELVIMTGGLGPTKDDLTKEMLADYFGRQLVFDRKAYDRIDYLARKVYGLAGVSDSNAKQAFVLENSLVLYNTVGSAPGCIVEDENRKAVILPGPPKEMQPMFEQAADCYLKRLSDKIIVSMNIILKPIGEAPTSEVGEAQVADKLGEILDQANPTVATYAKETGVLIRVTAYADNKNQAVELLTPTVRNIQRILGDNIVSIGEAD